GAARALLDAARAAAKALLRTPGGMCQPGSDPGHLPGPLLREPLRLLAHAGLDVEKTERTHAELLRRLDDAEARLDLLQAGLVVDEIATIYSGASEVAAGLKDRLHRLDFYLQRIGQPRQSVQHMVEFLELAGLDHGMAS